MEFEEELFSEPVIKSFLQDFPETDWKHIIKQMTVHGIACYNSSKSLRFSKKTIPGLKLDEPKFPTQKSRDSSRQVPSNRSNSHSNFQKKCSGSHSCRHTSQSKSTGKSFKFDKNPPAKKLVGKEIKEKRIPNLGFMSHIFTIEDPPNLKQTPNPERIPKLLKPVELKQPHNLSSISAQVFCSSSEISDY